MLEADQFVANQPTKPLYLFTRAPNSMHRRLGRCQALGEHLRPDWGRQARTRNLITSAKVAKMGGPEFFMCLPAVVFPLIRVLKVFNAAGRPPLDRIWQLEKPLLSRNRPKVAEREGA